jgi:type II secretory pathway pseudopilin PulG
MSRVGIVVVLALAGIAVGCVAPARTDSTYKAKAADTADAVVSAARTALLAARVGGTERSFASTTAVVVADAEGDAASARDAFASIQPPDAQSDALRRRLLPDVERAVDLIELVRIAARRADADGLTQATVPLSALADRLERFVTTYG